MIINCNTKGGIDTVEFEKYLKEPICPFYIDAANVPRLRVLIIIDNGPGCCNIPILES